MHPPRSARGCIPVSAYIGAGAPAHPARAHPAPAYPAAAHPAGAGRGSVDGSRERRRGSGRQPPKATAMGPRAKYRTNPAATIHRRGLISLALPVIERMTTQEMKPAPMPFAIE